MGIWDTLKKYFGVNKPKCPHGHSWYTQSLYVKLAIRGCKVPWSCCECGKAIICNFPNFVTWNTNYFHSAIHDEYGRYIARLYRIHSRDYAR